MNPLFPFFLLGSLLSPMAFPWSLTPQATNLFYHTTPGILRAEEGTAEFRLQMNRAYDKTYHPWDILFSVPSSQPIGKAILGIFMPPAPEQGLRVVYRDGVHSRYLSHPNFSWSVGKPFLIALSWGKALRLYVNGKKVAERDIASPLPEALMATFLKVDRSDRYDTEAARFSSVERTADSLWTDPTCDFNVDADTTLLATSGLSLVKTFPTAWSTSVHTLKPLFLERFSTLDTSDDPVFPLLGMNATKTARTIQVRIVAMDTAGKSVAVLSNMVLPAESPVTQYVVPLPALKKMGYYKIQSEIGAGATPSVYQSTIAVFPPKAPAGKLSHWLGQHYEEPFDLVAYDKAALMTLRVAPSGMAAFAWPRVEPVKGKWDWKLADDLVAQTEKRHIDLIGILGYNPRWAAVEPADPDTIKSVSGSAYWKPRSVEEFGNYVYQTVSRYKGRVSYWEVWNEVDWHPPAPAYSFTGSTEEYLGLLKEAYTQAKRADPSCRILISGFGMFGDVNMPKDLMQRGAGAYFDIFNFHAYAGALAYQPLKELLAERKPGVPSWNSEHMWHEMSGGPKRDYLSVASLLWFMEKGVARYYYMGMNQYFYDFTTRSPNIEYWVVGHFQSMLRRFDSFAGLLSFPGDLDFSVRHALKKCDGTMLNVIGSELGEFEIAVDNKVLFATDLYGNRVEPIMRNGRGVIQVKNIAYLMTADPLRVVSSRATTGIALYQNGGFEEVAGDIALGGLAAGKPLHWTFRETLKDPGGKIELSTSSRSGKYGLALSSSGKGVVYAFQDVRIPAPGTYTLSGYLKNASADKAPQVGLSFFDRGANKVIDSTSFTLKGSGFTLLTHTIQMTNVPSLPCGISFWIRSGEGGVVLDDIFFGKGEAVPATIDYSTAMFIDLSRAANQTYTDEIAGDGKGGFADMGLHNFSRVATGDRLFSSNAFRILSDEKGSKPSCVVLGGSERPQFPLTVKGIPVNTKVTKLSLLHTALYVKANSGETLGSMVIHYQNGKSAVLPLICKENSDDWYQPSPGPGLLSATVTLPDHSTRAVFIAGWHNPEPDETVSAIDFTSTGKGVLVFLAATGSKFSP